MPQEKQIGDFDLIPYTHALNLVKEQQPDTSGAGRIPDTVPLSVFMQSGIRQLIALDPEATMEGTHRWGIASASYNLDSKAVDLTSQTVLFHGRRQNEVSIQFSKDPKQLYVVTANGDVVRLEREVSGVVRHDPTLDERAKVVEAIDDLTAQFI